MQVTPKLTNSMLTAASRPPCVPHMTQTAHVDTLLLLSCVQCCDSSCARVIIRSYFSQKHRQTLWQQSYSDTLTHSHNKNTNQSKSTPIVTDHTHTHTSNIHQWILIIALDLVFLSRECDTKDSVRPIITKIKSDKRHSHYCIIPIHP